MINRELIRLKVVQVSFAHYESDNHTIASAEDELKKSLANAYYLYNILLLLLVDLRRVALMRLEQREARALRLGEDATFNHRFVDNRLLRQLADNAQLKAFQKALSSGEGEATAVQANFEWSDKEEFVVRMLSRFEQSEDYQAYMSAEATSYADDREFVRRLYRDFFCENDELSDELESLSLYWNDDKAIVDTFVLKTIRRFEEKNGKDQPLLPEYDYDDDRSFATSLLRVSLREADTFRRLIEENSRGWNLARMPLMDVIILQTALAEITTFPTIPASVSINEYVEIAKMYSTPRSGGYINGMLDALTRRLHDEGRLAGKQL